MTTRQEWLAKVANAAAANIGASELHETVVGLSREDVDAMSEAELSRLEWAVEEVQRRLYRMGKR